MPAIAIAVLIVVGLAAYLLATEEGQSLLANLGGPVTQPDVGLPAASLPFSDTGSAGSSSVVELKVRQMAEAIAVAEGFYVVGSVPNRSHNPGDLGPGDCGPQYPIIHATGSDVCVLPDDVTGWMLFYQKLRRIFEGRSQVYNVNMTFTQFAQKYAGDWRPWVSIVTQRLGVKPDTTISAWLGL